MLQPKMETVQRSQIMENAKWHFHSSSYSLLHLIDFFMIMATLVLPPFLFLFNALGADLAVGLTTDTGGDILSSTSSILLQTRRRRTAAVYVLYCQLGVAKQWARRSEDLQEAGVEAGSG